MKIMLILLALLIIAYIRKLGKAPKISNSNPTNIHINDKIVNHKGLNACLRKYELRANEVGEEVAYQFLIEDLKANKVVCSEEILKQRISNIKAHHALVNQNIEKNKKLDNALGQSRTLSSSELRIIKKLEDYSNPSINEIIHIYSKTINTQVNSINASQIKKIHNICDYYNLHFSDAQIRKKLNTILAEKQENNKSINEKYEINLLNNKNTEDHLKKLQKKLNSKEGRIYLEKFILSITSEYDNGNINDEEYKNELETFADLLFNNKIINFKTNFMFLNFVIEEIKIDIKKNNLLQKLSITNLENIEDIYKKYINYYAEDTFNINNINLLSNALNISVKEIEQKLNYYQNDKKAIDLYDRLFHDFSNDNIEYIDNLTGFEFEDYLADLFNNFGYKIERTPYSGDNGADLIISDNIHRLAIQAKNYIGNAVGNNAIQEIFTAKSFYKCSKSMVITNSYYTKQAIKLAKSTNTILIDRDELKKILKQGREYFHAYYMN